MNKQKRFFISVGDILRSKSYREGRFFGGGEEKRFVWTGKEDFPLKMLFNRTVAINTKFCA